MELYITGDTHGDFSRFRPESFYEQERLTKEDVILIAGKGHETYQDVKGVKSHFDDKEVLEEIFKGEL